MKTNIKTELYAQNVITFFLQQVFQTKDNANFKQQVKLLFIGISGLYIMLTCYLPYKFFLSPVLEFIVQKIVSLNLIWITVIVVAMILVVICIIAKKYLNIVVIPFLELGGKFCSKLTIVEHIVRDKAKHGSLISKKFENFILGLVDLGLSEDLQSKSKSNDAIFKLKNELTIFLIKVNRNNLNGEFYFSSENQKSGQMKLVKNIIDENGQDKNVVLVGNKVSELLYGYKTQKDFKRRNR